MNGLKRIALTVCGTASVALGAVGMFVPVLPTTPFLLLAAVCYARSSKRFYDWLVTNRWCGAYIRNYREGRGISRRHKTFALALLWLTIGHAACFAVALWWVKILLLGIAVAVTVHLLTIRTFRPTAPMPQSPEAQASQEGRATIHEEIGRGRVTA